MSIDLESLPFHVCVTIAISCTHIELLNWHCGIQIILTFCDNTAKFRKLSLNLFQCDIADKSWGISCRRLILPCKPECPILKFNQINLQFYTWCHIQYPLNLLTNGDRQRTRLQECGGPSPSRMKYLQTRQNMDEVVCYPSSITLSNWLLLSNTEHRYR